MDTSKDGMTDIVERLRADVDINNDFVMSSEEFLEAADEIEYLRKQLAEKDVGLDAATQIINQHVADLDTLTQQLADCEAAADLIAQRNAELEEDNQPKKDHIAHFRRQLAEAQARDAVRIEALEIASDFLADRMHTAPINRIDRALAMPSDSTALDEAIRQAKRDFLLEVANRLGLEFDELERRMADELKPADVEQTNKG